MIMINDFKKEVFDWADELNLKPKEIYIKKLRRKWGSCSRDGKLIFSYELLNEPFEIRSAVIVHELLHLRYPNHSKMFNLLWMIHLKRKGINHSKVVERL